MHALLGVQDVWEVVQEGLEDEAPIANPIANLLGFLLISCMPKSSGGQLEIKTG